MHVNTLLEGLGEKITPTAPPPAAPPPIPPAQAGRASTVISTAGLSQSQILAGQAAARAAGHSVTGRGGSYTIRYSPAAQAAAYRAAGVTGGAAPRYSVRPVTTPYRAAPVRLTRGQSAMLDPDFRATLPFFDESRGFRYSREQIQEMIERGKATAQEITDRQTKEGGDGIAEDLEQQATEDSATEKAVRDATAAKPGAKVTPKPGGQNLVPLGIAALLAYVLL